MCEFMDLNISGHDFIFSAVYDGLVLEVIKPYNDRKLCWAKYYVMAKSALHGTVQSATGNFILSYLKASSVLNWCRNLLQY